jgi:hypothetical protein
MFLSMEPKALGYKRIPWLEKLAGYSVLGNQKSPLEGKNSPKVAKNSPVNDA